MIAGYIANDQDTGRMRTVRDFVSEFNGLATTTKRKAVLGDVGLHRQPLTALMNGVALDPQRVRELLASMQRHSRPVTHRRLGIVGKDHLAQHFEECGCRMETFEYRKVLDETDGRPEVLEVAFGWCPTGDADEYARVRRLVTGINWSAAIINPFRQLGREHGWDSLDSLLERLECGDEEEVVIFLHLARPRAEFTDRGKTAIVMDKDTLIWDALTRVTKKFTALRKKENRQERRLDREIEMSNRQARRTIREVAWEVMDEAYWKASGGDRKLPAGARQIMYAARPTILEETGKTTFSDDYFTQTLLPDYIEEIGRDWNVVYDARGHLHEPHTGLILPLGTLEVRDHLRKADAHVVLPLESTFPLTYPTCGPTHRYAGILFIEKEGFMPLFEAVRLAERYDLAIMSTKGLSVTAARQLIDALCGEHDIPLLTLHDFDKAGFSIVGTVGSTNKRYTFSNDIQVIDLGLRLADVVAHELQSEPVAYGKQDPEKLRENLRANGATEEEIDFLILIGPTTPLATTGKRVELNAFTADALIDFIEGKLVKHGIKKVVPDTETLKEAYRRAAQADYVNDHMGKLLADGAVHAAEISMPSYLRRKIAQRVKDERVLAWDDAIAEVMQEEETGP